MTNTVDYRKFSCGFPEEWEEFEKRHQLFLERFSKLIAALNAAFIRRTTLSEHIDKLTNSEIRGQTDLTPIQPGHTAGRWSASNTTSVA